MRASSGISQVFPIFLAPRTRPAFSSFDTEPLFFPYRFEYSAGFIYLTSSSSFS